jgi:protein-tyrosine phosphatase
MKILFVCLGNICRSPIAEGVMKHLVEKENLTWTIESSSTNTYHTGEAPHKYSQFVCREHGIDISTQRARRFSIADFDKFDKIYVMAHDVLKDIKSISGLQFQENKVDFFLNELHESKNLDVIDPWYGELEGYYDVYNQIEATCKIIIKKYQS